jgi:endonuclease YncB( thermonuclease family)
MKFALLIGLIALISTSALAEQFAGQVISVADGDTIRVLTADKTEIKIRLTEIDAPEKGQPYGEKAKQALSKAVFKKIVAIESAGKDRYGRTLGRVMIGTRDINAEMVATGSAWVYRKYSKDLQLINLEDVARSKKLGLWALPADQIVAPWEWRVNRKRN